MKEKFKAEIIYSEDLECINDKRFKDWAIHILCLDGTACFSYNGNEINIYKNDAVVISHPNFVTNIIFDDKIKVSLIAAPFNFLYSLLPANHYGVKGCISLFEDPVMPLSEEDAKRLYDDFMRIKDRMNERDNLFYDELIGSLALTMVYDLFNFHAKLHGGMTTTDRKSDITRNFISLLEAGRAKHYREAGYYAEQLNVTAKYLSDTIRRTTGRSVTYLIDQHTIPMITDYLKNSKLSLSQISDEMNFSSLSYFCRYVQKHLGMTPSQYRDTHSQAKK